MKEIGIVPEGKESFTLRRDAVAYIDSKRCLNCGTCREVCPVEAIHENQRRICRVCPECSDQPAMTLDEIDEFCTKQSCTTACPLGISPQGYINLVKEGKMDEAYKLVWSKDPLPSVCGHVCHHPCEQVCKRGVLVDDPIAIRGIKRYLSENVSYTPDMYPIKHDERIAVIGAGPAGLAAGHFLSQAGYEVTVFEGNTQAGGMMVRGIPEFRLDREAVHKDVANLEKAGLTIKAGQRIGKNMIDELKKEYDVIIIAAGLPHSKELHVPGFRYDGIYTALQFMEFVNSGQAMLRMPHQNFDVTGEGIVIGGGSVAMDTARAALRKGAKKVTVVCLEEGAAVPAHQWEVDEARDEGIEFMEGYSPKRFVGKVNTLTGVEFAKVTSFNKDRNGKISFTVDDKKLYEIKADFCIVAIGQYADDFWPAEDGETIFYAGDIKSSACSVIDALASGRKAAYDVDAKLTGRILKQAEIGHELQQAPMEEKIFPCNRRKTERHTRPVLDVEERIKSFDEVEKSYTEKQVGQEVLRCLECGYEVVDPEKCIGCGICMMTCPEGSVITMIANNEGGK